MFFSFGRWKWRISPRFDLGLLALSFTHIISLLFNVFNAQVKRQVEWKTSTQTTPLATDCSGLVEEMGRQYVFHRQFFLKKVALTLAGNTPSEIRRMWNGKLKPRLQAPRACKSLQIVSAKVFAWCHIVKKLPTRAKGGTGSFAPLARYQALKEPQNTWSKQAI